MTTLALLALTLAAPQNAPPPGAAWSERVPRAPSARHFDAAPDGRPEAPGTRAEPWNLASALAGRRALAPGDVLWVRGGTYRGPFEVRLAGTEAAPIHVRAVPGERATILDGGLRVSEPAAGLWIWDLELAGSVPLEAGAFLPPGTPFRLLDPHNLHGPPVLRGRAPEGPLALPVAGEFAAFVLVKETAP
jgi:hypothetical protein